MEQLDAPIETSSNDSPDCHPEQPEVDNGNSHADTAADYDIRFGDAEERLRKQLRALKERLKALKEVVLESNEAFANPDDDPSQVSPRTLQQQVYYRQILSDITNQRNSYSARVQSLEERVGRLLSSELFGGNGTVQNLVDQRGVVVVDPDLYYEMHREGGYLSQLERETLRMHSDHESTESEILAKLVAVKAEKVMVEADRDTLIDENEDLREKLKTILFRYEVLVQQRNSIQSDSSGIETLIDTSEDEIIDLADDGEEIIGRDDRRELHIAQHHDTTQAIPAASTDDFNEAQITLIRSERDSAIQQNEDARRTLATRTAERNGAHQRIRILEASLTESQEKIAQVQAEIRRKETQERTQANVLDTEVSTREVERKEVGFLQEELEHAVAAASMAQHERDVARVEIKVLQAENAIAHSAAETAHDVVTELQASLEAANNAALAEREKSEDCRRTQNRLRVERETLRIEVGKLGKALNEAHQVSMGLVRHGNITIGDLVHIQEERDAALARLGTLQAELDKATGTANELQMALDECLSRHANGPTDYLAMEELNRVIAQRDEALAHVKELERLLEDLEDDYRTNLDQWERQTQRDEKEIHDCRDLLEEEKKQNKTLSNRLEAANITLQEVEARAATAEARSRTLEIQNQQIGQDLDHSNEDREELEAACERLRAECHRLESTVVALRNEVIRLGGRIVAPDGTVQREDSWPDGAPSLGPGSSEIPTQPIPAPRPEQHQEKDNHSVPHPRQRSTSTRRRPRKASNVYESSISDLSSVESDVSVPNESHLPWRPKSRPARRSDSTAPLRTSPTMSTQLNPRTSRNPQPYYGASNRSRSLKRKADADREESGVVKKKRSKS
ncbi:hypothetical protein IFR04_011489 [Cadophora malorum]|uniref:Uncharacterized protein n=1 Tax=Cadophora malorum TaxID=108018 RepID=A0A8H7W7Q4_9HELO|nr:hypothetical protein IFR04_011489 [Cadophora malorum]